MGDKIVAMLFIAFLGIKGLSAQHTVTITVEGISSDQGQVCAALYADKDSFLKFDKVYKVATTKAVKGTTQLTLDNVQEGTYAAAIFHDKNGNNKLDTNFLGIPKEPVGFSNASLKMFGPPSFKECSFTVATNTALSVEMNN